MFAPVPKLRVAYDDPAAVARLSRALAAGFRRLDPVGAREVVVLGIGTDRSTGDSLGPLVGSKIAERPRGPRVMGTLDQPVHATNLADHLRLLGGWPRPPIVVAVDACLGQRDSIGYITVAEGPLRPGAGVHKELPAVGDLHVTGVVNVAGYMEYMVLQNTRLSLVMRMADRIAAAIMAAWESTYALGSPAGSARLAAQEASG
ncbi:MAG: spore protease YyaC [Moorellales bacterium]